LQIRLAAAGLYATFAGFDFPLHLVLARIRKWTITSGLSLWKGRVANPPGSGWALCHFCRV
ncbi:hypothetical protein QZK99_26355, partial [Escherichia coli]